MSIKHKAPYVIVLGNEKGGTGKSSLAMHVTVALLYKGYKVATCDLDGYQGTFSRYLHNRTLYYPDLPAPVSHTRFEADMSFEAWMKTQSHQECVVVDTPGHRSDVSMEAHAWANLLMTPLNESFIDVDLLAHLGHTSQDVKKPGVYAEMVWNQKKKRALQGHSPMHWVVVRNRCSRVRSRNQQEVKESLTHLSKRFGFEIAHGFGERTVFRQLFLEGLTISDLVKEKKAKTATSSVSRVKKTNITTVAAHQDLRMLMKIVEGRLKSDQSPGPLS